MTHIEKELGLRDEENIKWLQDYLLDLKQGWEASPQNAHASQQFSQKIAALNLTPGETSKVNAFLMAPSIGETETRRQASGLATNFVRSGLWTPTAASFTAKDQLSREAEQMYRFRSTLRSRFDSILQNLSDIFTDLKGWWLKVMSKMDTQDTQGWNAFVKKFTNFVDNVKQVNVENYGDTIRVLQEVLAISKGNISDSTVLSPTMQMNPDLQKQLVELVQDGIQKHTEAAQHAVRAINEHWAQLVEPKLVHLDTVLASGVSFSPQAVTDLVSRMAAAVKPVFDSEQQKRLLEYMQQTIMAVGQNTQELIQRQQTAEITPAAVVREVAKMLTEKTMPEIQESITQALKSARHASTLSEEGTRRILDEIWRAISALPNTMANQLERGMPLSSTLVQEQQKVILEKLQLILNRPPDQQLENVMVILRGIDRTVNAAKNQSEEDRKEWSPAMTKLGDLIAIGVKDVSETVTRLAEGQAALTASQQEKLDKQLTTVFKALETLVQDIAALKPKGISPDEKLSLIQPLTDMKSEILTAVSAMNTGYNFARELTETKLRAEQQSAFATLAALMQKTERTVATQGPPPSEGFKELRDKLVRHISSLAPAPLPQAFEGETAPSTFDQPAQEIRTINEIRKEQVGLDANVVGTAIAANAASVLGSEVPSAQASLPQLFETVLTTARAEGTKTIEEVSQRSILAATGFIKAVAEVIQILLADDSSSTSFQYPRTSEPNRVFDLKEHVLANPQQYTTPKVLEVGDLVDEMGQGGLASDQIAVAMADANFLPTLTTVLMLKAVLTIHHYLTPQQASQEAAVILDHVSQQCAHLLALARIFSNVLEDPKEHLRPAQVKDILETFGVPKASGEHWISFRTQMERLQGGIRNVAWELTALIWTDALGEQSSVLLNSAVAWRDVTTSDIRGARNQLQSAVATATTVTALTAGNSPAQTLVELINTEGSSESSVLRRSRKPGSRRRGGFFATPRKKLKSGEEVEEEKPLYADWLDAHVDLLPGAPPDAVLEYSQFITKGMKDLDADYLGLAGMGREMIVRRATLIGGLAPVPLDVLIKYFVIKKGSAADEYLRIYRLKDYFIRRENTSASGNIAASDLHFDGEGYEDYYYFAEAQFALVADVPACWLPIGPTLLTVKKGEDSIDLKDRPSDYWNNFGAIAYDKPVLASVNQRTDTILIAKDVLFWPMYAKFTAYVGSVTSQGLDKFTTEVGRGKFSKQNTVSFRIYHGYAFSIERSAKEKSGRQELPLFLKDPVYLDQLWSPILPPEMLSAALEKVKKTRETLDPEKTSLPELTTGAIIQSLLEAPEPIGMSGTQPGSGFGACWMLNPDNWTDEQTMKLIAYGQLHTPYFFRSPTSQIFRTLLRQPAPLAQYNPAYAPSTPLEEWLFRISTIVQVAMVDNTVMPPPGQKVTLTHFSMQTSNKAVKDAIEALMATAL